MIIHNLTSKNMNVIILCGGLATRLKSITHDEIPKCLLKDKDGLSVLDYQLNHLSDPKLGLKVDSVILAIGNLAPKVIEYVEGIKSKYEFPIRYSIEDTPLGTGGAISKAMDMIYTGSVLVMNGDCINDINLMEFVFRSLHLNPNGISIALKNIEDTSRYGEITIDVHEHILSWIEKSGDHHSGLINRGIYMIRDLNLIPHKITKYSIERDYFMKKINANQYSFTGIRCDGSFIDIGVPEDYQRFYDKQY